MVVPVGWRNKVELADKGMDDTNPIYDRETRDRLSSLALNTFYMLIDKHVKEIRNVTVKEMNRGYENFTSFNRGNIPRKAVVVC